MKPTGKTIILSAASVLLVGALAMNFTGGFSAILSPASTREVTDPISIDFITIQTLVKAVSTKEISAKTFVEAIDSVNRTVEPSNVRNPFVEHSTRKQTVQRAVKKPPTRKPAVKKKRPKVTVNGIVWDPADPYAILNGEVYRVGDELNGYTVQAITDTLVILSNPEDEFTITYERE